MLKKLRRRLTAIFTALTGAIFAVILGLSLWFTLQQAQQTAAITFSSGVSLASVTLSTNPYPVADWLQNTERANNYVLQANINARGVPFTPGWQPRTDRGILVNRAIVMLNDPETAYIMPDPATDANDFTIVQGQVEATPASEATGFGSAALVQEDGATEPAAITSFSLSIAQNLPYFEMNGDYGDVYRVCYADTFNNQNYYELLVIQDTAAERRGVLLTIAGYTGLFLLGLTLLWLVSLQLSKLVLKPTEQSLQRQADFVAAASHELRSPLAVVRSSLSAADVVEDEKKAQKYRRAAEEEAERMGRLVDDLLLLAGGDSGKWNLRTETVDIDTLMIELSEQYKPLARQKKRTLLLRLPEETMGEITADKDRLRQIVAILLDNALEYAPVGTGIVLGACRKKGKLAISVIDQGEGIPDTDKAKVFHRFYRADESRKDKAHFGLGLSVAKELAELHGGTLELADTPGGGASFTLLLPAARNGTPTAEGGKRQA